MADALVRLLSELGSNARTVREFPAVVSAVRHDGRVNLRVMGALIDGVPALSSYAQRAAGDVVLIRARGNQWVVVAAVGHAREPISTGDPVAIAWGTTTPAGDGWRTGTVYVRQNQVYVQMATTPPDPDIPATALLIPTEWKNFRNDQQTDDLTTPIQGAATLTDAPITAVWYYGNTLINAINAAPVASVRLQLIRSGDRHGIFERQDVHLCAHNEGHSWPHTPVITLGPTLAQSLELGEDGWWTLPAAWIGAIGDSGARGFLAQYAGTVNDYIEFDPASGTIEVTYQ